MIWKQEKFVLISIHLTQFFELRVMKTKKENQAKQHQLM